MAEIIFEALIPDADVTHVLSGFQRACTKLKQADKVVDITVSVHDPSPSSATVEPGLREAYALEHDGLDLLESHVVRYVFTVTGASGSLNGLATALAGFFTSPVDLPNDPVALHNESAFLQPARYPWMVHVRA